MFCWRVFPVLSNVKSNWSYFSVYHQNNSLLFQFILSEFLITYRETLLISNIVKVLKKTSLPINWNADCEQSLCKIKSILKSLGGVSYNQQRLFSWGHDESTLGKLKNTCALFCRNVGKDDKNAATLHRHCHRAWLLCLQSLDLLRSLKGDKNEDPSFSFPLLLNLIEKMANALHRFSRLITRLLHDFKEDENVLFFVLRHQEQIDGLFGSHFVVQLLTEMFSNLGNAEQYISRKYEDRGFNHLLPLITKKISEFQVIQV